MGKNNNHEIIYPAEYGKDRLKAIGCQDSKGLCSRFKAILIIPDRWLHVHIIKSFPWKMILWLSPSTETNFLSLLHSNVFSDQTQIFSPQFIPFLFILSPKENKNFSVSLMEKKFHAWWLISDNSSFHFLKPNNLNFPPVFHALHFLTLCQFLCFFLKKKSKKLGRSLKVTQLISLLRRIKTHIPQMTQPTLFYKRISQPPHYWHFRSDNSLW